MVRGEGNILIWSRLQKRLAVPPMIDSYPILTEDSSESSGMLEDLCHSGASLPDWCFN
jgi:hypothetical protein